jgi:hypothetical protein
MQACFTELPRRCFSAGAIGSRYGDAIRSGAKKGPSAPSMGQVRNLAMLSQATRDRKR